MYLYNQPGLGEAKKLVHRRRSNRVSAPVPSPVAGFGEFGAPIFDFPQPCAECPVGTAAQCRAALRQAIVRAIGLATNAAAKIEAAISVAPAARNADAKRTATLFVRFFGHDPSRPVSWAGNEASGISVAKRFRSVATELNGGRRVIFQCRATRPDCADDDVTCCCPDTNAFFSPAVANTINLCALFWGANRDIRAGIIIHEMLHMLFGHLQDVGQGRIRNACYEAFALRLVGVTPDPFDVCNCRATPCPPNPFPACPA
jgi:lysine-specific metallo-endopeptidase family protein